MSDAHQAAVDETERAEVSRAVRCWNPSTRIERIEWLDGMTNRSYKVLTSAGSIAVRLPGPGTDAYIDRDAERHNASLAATLGIGAVVLHADRAAMISTFIEGHTLTPLILQAEPETLARVGRLLRLLHQSGVAFVSRFDPVAAIEMHRSGLVELPRGVDVLIDKVRPLGAPQDLVPCHVDPWPGNFIDTGDDLRLLDWEYSGMGDPAWDLADLVVEAELGADHRDALIRAYWGSDPDPQLRGRVDELAPVCDVLWGLWALTQERNGNRSVDFGSYGRRRLERAARTLG